MEPRSGQADSSDEEVVRSRLLPGQGPFLFAREDTADSLRLSSSCRVGRLAAVLGLSLAAAVWLVANGGPELREAGRPSLRVPAVELASTRKESENPCERCPVGACVRGSSGSCRLWDDHGGGYYCEVDDCKKVPFSSPTSQYHFSECWTHQGSFFYAVQDPHFPCQVLKASGAARAAEPSTATEAPTTPAEATTTTAEATTTTAEATTTTAEATTTTAAATTTTEAPTTTALAESTTTTVAAATPEAHTTTRRTSEPAHNATEDSARHVAKETLDEHAERRKDEPPKRQPSSVMSIFERAVADIAEEAIVHNPRLAAYWDLADCGPVGDDHNAKKWCGGLVDEPDCQLEVEVDIGLCLSERATLAFLKHQKGSNVQLGACTYVYYAQYECVATTTTTTTATTTTSSTTTITTTTSTTTTTTVTTSTTSSTTSTTTTSKTTTTIIEEGDMMAALEELESSITGPDGSWTREAGFGSYCTERFQPPPAPWLATDLNGVRLPDVCFKTPGPHYVHVIADWGGMLGPHGPYPACQRPKKTFVKGVDDYAQQRVAMQMARKAFQRSPDYILNGGDNFYWGGIDTPCGANARTITPTGQLEWNFEKIYTGEGLEDKPWLGVLGNHDYGGYRFDKGWDQLISYTWGQGGRWVMPGQYWAVSVRYPGFVVDYYFLDTNVFNAQDPHADPEHNICSGEHNTKEATCGAEGPSNVSQCSPWFASLWERQKRWLQEHLEKTKSDWQIVVTHFPPYYGKEFWETVSRKYGLDMIVTGHVHKQELHADDAGNFLRPTAWIVSGGGGGITSEDIPDSQGRDDMYGFFELTMTKDIIEVQGISHGGEIRKMAFVRPRRRADEIA